MRFILILFLLVVSLNGEAEATLTRVSPHGFPGHRCMVTIVQSVRKVLGRSQHYGWKVTKKEIIQQTPSIFKNRTQKKSRDVKALQKIATTLDEATIESIKEYLKNKELFEGEDPQLLGIHFEQRFQGKNPPYEASYDLLNNEKEGLEILAHYDRIHGTNHFLPLALQRFSSGNLRYQPNFSLESLIRLSQESSRPSATAELLSSLSQSENFWSRFNDPETIPYNVMMYDWPRDFKKLLNKVIDGSSVHQPKQSTIDYMFSRLLSESLEQIQRDPSQEGSYWVFFSSYLNTAIDYNATIGNKDHVKKYKLIKSTLKKFALMRNTEAFQEGLREREIYVDEIPDKRFSSFEDFLDYVLVTMPLADPK